MALMFFGKTGQAKALLFKYEKISLTKWRIHQLKTGKSRIRV